METLLRKHLWVVDLVAVAASALSTARAASTVAEARLARHASGERLAVAELAPPGVAQSAGRKEISAIVARNLLCLRPPRVAPQLMQLRLRLIAVMYASSPAQQRWSVAVIRDEEAMTAGPYVLGSAIRDATITTIAATYVDVERRGASGGRQRLQLVGSPARASEPIAPAHDIDRAQVEALVANPLPLIRDVHAIPELRDGKPIGFRLLFRGQPLLSGLGFTSGDVIRSVGGIEMTGPAQALHAFERFRAADHLSVIIERNGGTLVQEYRIRSGS
jgi:general secretion pathway protein C